MFFVKKVVTPPIIREPYDISVYVGKDPTDVKEIHLAIQKGLELSMDKYGRVFDSTGRYIADCTRRGL